MTLKTNLLLSALLLVAMTGAAFAQEALSGMQAVENLRTRLADVKDREAGIKMRLEELDYEMKPDTLERYFNGYGSTRPEELREGRRRKLQIEKDRLMGQLDELATNRNHLESEISLAQARAFQQSARLPLAIQPDRNRFSHLITFTRALIGLSVLLLVLAGLALRIFIRHRTHV